MKTKDLRNLTAEELKHKQLSLKEDLIKLRSHARLGTLEKPSHIKDARRTLAKIATVLKEKKENVTAPR